MEVENWRRRCRTRLPRRMLEEDPLLMGNWTIRVLDFDILSYEACEDMGLVL